jgi:uncharacterized membrane protein
MAEDTRGWGDRRIELIIGSLLRTGVVLSAAVVLVGAASYLSQYGRETADYLTFRGAPEYLRTLPGIFSAALSFDGRAIIQFGLLLLILTPVARVVFALVGFAREGDRLYAAVSLVVLGLLCYGLATG